MTKIMETTLKNELTEWVKAYKDVAERNALAETPKESAEYLLSLILSEIDKAALKKAQITKIDKEHLRLLEWLKDEESHLDYRDWKIIKAQLEAIKKVLK